MNTYPRAELRAKHDYSSITATLTLQLVHRQLQINIDDSIATIMHQSCSELIAKHDYSRITVCNTLHYS